MQHNDYDVAIIGGGPAGSTAGAYLARMGFSVCIIERKEFPREVLCGEFLSREVLDILADLGLQEQFHLLKPNPLSSFRYCPEYPRTFSSPLPFRGYGLKRGAFDMLMLQAAHRAGAAVMQPAEVVRIDRNGSGFELAVSVGADVSSIRCTNVVIAYGKFNALDRTIRGSSLDRPSSLNGIKFHVPKRLFVDFPGNEIQIFTTDRLYCGVNCVNDDTVTVCFLEERSHDDPRPRDRLADLIRTNRHFRKIVRPEFSAEIESLPIYGTGNIYFGKRSLSENGMLMIGDAARVIAPLAGDGIGMAMQSGKLAAESLQEGRLSNLQSDEMLRRYSHRWHSLFRKRLWTAGMVQKVFLTKMGRGMSTRILSIFPGVLSSIIEKTRG
jgi:flavin-dependent dehydrogenase